MVMAVDIWDAAVVVIITDGAEAADITMVGVGNSRISQTKKRPPQLATFLVSGRRAISPFGKMVLKESSLVPNEIFQDRLRAIVLI
jgi:hypothetical protein